MIAVVTGGSGFIGTSLVKWLTVGGHEVRCLTRPGGGAAPKGASSWPVDYARPGTLVETPALDGADVVFHLAGATNAVSSRHFFEANVTPTDALLAAIAKRHLKLRVVLVSSQAAGGPSTVPVAESSATRPVEAYGHSKRAGERLAESYAGAFEITIARLCSVLGPRDRAFLPLFWMATRGVIAYPGVERQRIHWLYVDDAVEGLLRAATSPAAVGRTYNLATHDPIEWRELGEAIAAAVGRSVRHLNVPLPLVRLASEARDLLGRVTGTAAVTNRSKAALASQPAWLCSTRRAREDLAFAPTRSLAEAVRETYLWYVRHDWLAPRRAAGPGR